jgi:hypothetical protein
LEGELIGVFSADDNFDNTGVHDHFGAHIAGLSGAVDCGSRSADAKESSLDDGVLLGVKTSDAMPIDHVAADIFTVSKSHRSAVVAGGEDATLSDYDSSDMAAVACGAAGHIVSDFHEVFIP